MDAMSFGQRISPAPFAKGACRRGRRLSVSSVAENGGLCYNQAEDFSWMKRVLFMNNPWREISLNGYERHMRLDSVMQLQAMNALMRDQFRAYPVSCIMVLGVAGGNCPGAHCSRAVRTGLWRERQSPLSGGGCRQISELEKARWNVCVWTCWKPRTSCPKPEW